MTNTINQNPTCKAVCWLIGIAAGGYLAVVLVNDFGQAQVQSAVLGIVTMLLSGLLLRRIFCRGRGSRVQRRVAEANARAANVKAQAAVVKPTRVTPVITEPTAKTGATSTANYDEEMVAKPAALMSGSGQKPALKSALKSVTKVAEETANNSANSSADMSAAAVPTTPLPPLKTTAADTVVPGVEVGKLDALRKPAAINSTPRPVSRQMPDAPVAPNPVTPNPVVVTLAAKKTAMVEEAAPQSEPKKLTPAPAAVAKSAKAAQVIKPSVPQGLDAPENGVADDLQKIEGIGATEETALNAAGIFHFAQFVTMNRRELAWLDLNIAENQDVEPSYEWRKQAIALTRKAG